MSTPPPMHPPQIVYVESRSNNLAVVSLIAGIVGILGALIPAFFIVGWGFGVTGFVLGIVALKKSKTLDGLRKTMSKWGIALSLAAFALGCVGFGIVQSAVSDLENIGTELESVGTGSTKMPDAYAECVDQAPTFDEMIACEP